MTLADQVYLDGFCRSPPVWTGLAGFEILLTGPPRPLYKPTHCPTSHKMMGCFGYVVHVMSDTITHQHSLVLWQGVVVLSGGCGGQVYLRPCCTTRKGTQKRPTFAGTCTTRYCFCANEAKTKKGRSLCNSRLGAANKTNIFSHGRHRSMIWHTLSTGLHWEPLKSSRKCVESSVIRLKSGVNL